MCAHGLHGDAIKVQAEQHAPAKQAADHQAHQGHAEALHGTLPPRGQLGLQRKSRPSGAPGQGAAATGG